jgi:cytochrome c oxidase subunit 2
VNACTIFSTINEGTFCVSAPSLNSPAHDPGGAHHERFKQQARPGVGLGLALLVVATVALAACGATPQTALEPVSEQARTANDLLLFAFWAAAAVFVVVEGALIYALIRFRRRRGDSLPAQTHGHLGLEIGWTIAPAILLGVLAALTVPAIFANAQAPSADAIRVQAIAHQWWFEFRYPELGVTTANELHVPVGRDVEIQLESDDVIHSFWVPRLRGKMDMVPGRVNRVVIRPDETGTFFGQCAEFCGTAHALMKFTVVVDAPAEFENWVALQTADRPSPQGALAIQGEALLTSGGCIACHTIRGTVAQGVIGPDLTHVGSRAHIASGILDNTPENLARWLRDPQEVKPGNKMLLPRPLSADEIESLAAYLQGLK